MGIMWQQQILHTDSFHLLYFFLIYSVMGWVFETCLVSITNKQFVNRGFLNGPFCPIYGIGASLVYLLLTPIGENIILLFLCGMILTTALEYVTAAIMETLFHAKWWDYSDRRFHIKGRVCLSVSFVWGFFSIIMLKVFQPIVLYLVDKIPYTFGCVFGSIFILYFIGDISITIYEVLHLNAKLANIDTIKEDLKERIANSRLYETAEEIRIRIDEMELPEFLAELRAKINTEKNTFLINSQNAGIDLENKLEQLQIEIKETLTRYHKILITRNIIERRLFKAYPKLRSFRHEDALQNMKKRINQMNKARKAKK